MISATRRCAGDDDDLRDQGFAKPSKRRGRGDGGAAPRARVAEAMEEVVVAQPSLGEGVRLGLGFRGGEGVRLGQLGVASLVCRTPLSLYL